MAEKEYIEREAFLTQKREQYCKDCSRRKGMRNGKYKTLYEIGEAPCRSCRIDDVLNDVEDFPAADVRPVSEIEKIIESLQEQADIYNARAKELLVEEDGQVSHSTHGRLIDADALLMRINHEVMEAYMDGVCYGVHPSQEYLYLLGEIIADAPTIIPASEE